MIIMNIIPAKGPILKKLFENLKQPDCKKRPKMSSATKCIHDQNRELGWDG